jgi:hypothetical protein
MDIEFFNEPVTFCIIRNFFSDDEKELCLTELNKLKPQLTLPGNTGGATSMTGQNKKNNKGIFLKEQNKILDVTSKIFREVAWETQKKHWLYKYLYEGVDYSTLISYYESGDYYKPHKDMSLITAIIYLWENPKSFSGGDLKFGDFTVPIDNNSLVIFPSVVEHEVTGVVGSGRWSISKFMRQRPVPVPEKLFYYDNFLHVSDFHQVQNITMNGQWRFGTQSVNSGDGQLFWIMDLTKNEFFSDYLFNLIKMTTRRDFKLLRVYANGQTYGQNGDFHPDDTKPNRWTFLLYTNSLPPTDMDIWGGETQFKLDKMITQAPIPNLGILFRSDVVHRGLGPSRLVRDLRVTVAWKLEECTGPPEN